MLAVLTLVPVIGAEESVPAKTRVLRRGDIVKVLVKGDDDLSKEYLVQDNGRIYFAPDYKDLVEGLPVEGKSLIEVRESLMGAIGPYFKEPSITVEFMPRTNAPDSASGDLDESVGVFGFFSGQGVLQGKRMPFRQGMKILDLLMETGAILPETDLKAVRYISGDTIRSVDLRNLVNGANLEMNLTLKPGDKLILRSKEPLGSFRAYLMGSVAKQGAYEVREGSLVLDLLMTGGGSVGRASVGKSFIIRTFGGKTRVLPVDVKRIIRFGDMSQNIPLKKNDVLFVPETGKANIKEIINTLSDISILRDRASNVSKDIQEILGEVQNK